MFFFIVHTAAQTRPFMSQPWEIKCALLIQPQSLATSRERDRPGCTRRRLADGPFFFTIHHSPFKIQRLPETSALTPPPKSVRPLPLRASRRPDACPPATSLRPPVSPGRHKSAQRSPATYNHGCGGHFASLHYGQIPKVFTARCRSATGHPASPARRRQLSRWSRLWIARSS